MTIISDDIARAAAILAREAVIAIPTETVYGLAGNIYSEQAIRKIFQLKQRPLFNPLIVHIPAIEYLDRIAAHIPEKARQLAAAFWPGPLTLVLEKQASIPDLVTANKRTVAVRVPDHPVALALLQQTNFPLAAPSANPFGSISPTNPQHVENYFRDDLAMVLDGGICHRGIESTIIGFEADEPVLYRMGSIAMEEIVAVVGAIDVKNKKEQAPDAPGMLSRHYAPETNTHLVEDIPAFIEKWRNKKIGLLLFNKKIDTPDVAVQLVLSGAGDLREAAAKLYAALHQLDALQLDMIVAEPFPDSGLGRSINDRLQRATKQK